MAIVIRGTHPDILIVDGIDPTTEFRPALQAALYAADPRRSPVHRASHHLWIAYPSPAQPSANPHSANFTMADDATGGRPLFGIGDMRAIPAGPDETSSALYVAYHESGHRWLVDAALQVPMPDGRVVPVRTSAGLTADVMHNVPYAAPALLGREDQHWSAYFQADASFMDGIGWEVAPAAYGLTRWTQADLDLPIQPEGLSPIRLYNRFCDLDLLCMGLRSAADCYRGAGGQISWLNPVITAGTPMQYLAGLFVAFDDVDFAYFGFRHDHATVQAVRPESSWVGPAVPVGPAYDALGSGQVAFRVVYTGSELRFQARMTSGPGDTDLFAGVSDTPSAGGDLSTWATIGTQATSRAPVAVGIMVTTHIPVLVEAEFSRLATWAYTEPSAHPTSAPLDGPLTTWPGGAISALRAGVLYRHTPQDTAMLDLIQTRPGGLALAVPWDPAFDHSAVTDAAPKVMMRAPNGPFAIGVVARVTRGAIGPAAAGGAGGTVIWGHQSSVPVSGVVVPSSLNIVEHEPLPWKAAFVVVTADAATVTDDELDRLEALRRYYETGAPTVSDGALRLRADLGWQGWKPVLGGIFAPLSEVAAVSVQEGWIDLFALGTDLRVWTAWFHGDAGWQGWQPVLDQHFSPSSTVSAVSDRPGWIDLFVVGPEGPVLTAWFHGAPGWQGWAPVPGGTFDQGTHVTAISRNSSYIELFALGQDRRVWTALLAPTFGWHPWTPLFDEHFAAGSRVAAVSSWPGQVDIFAVGATGQVLSAWDHGRPGWQGWAPIQGAGTFTQGTPVSAISPHPAQINLFAVGQDGQPYAAWLAGPAWQGWMPVQGGQFEQLTPVTAISPREDQINLFARAADGRIWTAWYLPDQGWQGWVPLRGETSFDRPAPTAAVTVRRGQVDLFLTQAGGGAVRTAWFDPTP